MVGLGVVFVMAVVAAVGLMVGVAAVDWPMAAGFICEQWILCAAKLGLERKDGLVADILGAQ